MRFTNFGRLAIPVHGNWRDFFAKTKQNGWAVWERCDKPATFHYTYVTHQQGKWYQQGSPLWDSLSVMLKTMPKQKKLPKFETHCGWADETDTLHYCTFIPDECPKRERRPNGE